MAFLWKIFRWLFGYTVLDVCGAYGEHFITLCMKHEVEIWEIRRICPGTIRISSFLISRKKLERLALQSGVSLQVRVSGGLPVLLKRYRFRYGIFLGILLYLAVVFSAPRFVWSVQVPGADPVQTARIKSVLSREGFGVGSFIPAIDYKQLRYAISLACPEVSFVSVNMEGCRAVVEVRFSHKAPEAVDDGSPCNIVASRDGQIVSVLVQSGMRYVKKGQTVQKGDLLVGGIMDTRLGYYVVHSKAKIMARVTDVSQKTVSLTQVKTRRTGRYKIKREWNLFGKTVDGSPHFSCPYERYETETVQKHLSFGTDSVVPVTLTETFYYETEVYDIQLTPEEAEGLARQRLAESDRLRLVNAEVETERETVSFDGQSVTVTCTRSLILDICQDKEFYFED